MLCTVTCSKPANAPVSEPSGHGGKVELSAILEGLTTLRSEVSGAQKAMDARVSAMQEAMEDRLGALEGLIQEVGRARL